MDENFSDNLKEVFKRSRIIAMTLGYDYISTLHLFLADCQLKQADSLYGFSFSTAEQFDNFFISAKLGEENKDSEFESLPITVEAESAIGDAELERILYKQSKIHSCHFFIAALKVKDSNFSECFNDDDTLLEKLVEYYKKIGAFESDKLPDREVKNQYYNPSEKGNFSFKNIFRFFKGR